MKNNSVINTKLNKYFKITIPAKIVSLKRLKDQFVKVIIEKGNNKGIFLTKTYYNSSSNQTYLFINKEIRYKLNINFNDEFKIIDICKIIPFRPKRKIFYKDLVDLLSLIPKKTKKGFRFFVEEFENNNEKWVNIWYYGTNCGSKQVWIKRFVNPEKLGSLLGIFQAEGTKFENIKTNQSPKLIFTNKSIDEHKQFINILRDFGISDNIIKVNVFYNPNNTNYKNYYSYINKFEKVVRLKSRTYKYPNQKKLFYAIQIAVERAALAELFLNAMDKVRILITSKKQNKVLQKFGESFLAKLLVGDGCLVTVKKREGGYVTQGYISDKNAKYRKDYRKILKNFGISVANWDNGNRVYFKCNNENLKFLYKIKAFKGTRSWKKLLKAILLKNRFLYQRFKKLNQFSNFSNQQFADIFGISLKGAVLWIRNNRKKDYIDISKINKNKHYYTLSNKAKNLLDFFNKCKLEITGLMKNDY